MLKKRLKIISIYTLFCFFESIHGISNILIGDEFNVQFQTILLLMLFTLYAFYFGLQNLLYCLEDNISDLKIIKINLFYFFCQCVSFELFYIKFLNYTSSQISLCLNFSDLNTIPELRISWMEYYIYFGYGLVDLNFICINFIPLAIVLVLLKTRRDIIETNKPKVEL